VKLRKPFLNEHLNSGFTADCFHFTSYLAKLGPLEIKTAVFILKNKYQCNCMFEFSVYNLYIIDLEESSIHDMTSVNNSTIQCFTFYKCGNNQSEIQSIFQENTYSYSIFTFLETRKICNVYIPYIGTSGFLFFPVHYLVFVFYS